MRTFNKILFRMGLATLLILILLRLLGVGLAQESPVIWGLSFAWPYLVGLALVSERNASLSRASPWSALLLMTTLMVGMLTSAAMGLPMGEVKIDAFLVGSFGFVLAVLCVGWWRLMRPTMPHASEAIARPWLYIVLAIVAAIGVVMDKLGFISA
jgi:hypothetical protein